MKNLVFFRASLPFCPKSKDCGVRVSSLCHRVGGVAGGGTSTHATQASILATSALKAYLSLP